MKKLKTRLSIVISLSMVLLFLMFISNSYAQVVHAWEFEALTPMEAQLDGGAGTAWDPATSAIDTTDYKSGAGCLSGFMAVAAAPAVNGCVTNWGTLGFPHWDQPMNINASGFTQNYVSIWCYMENTTTWASEYLFSIKLGSGANLDANNNRYVWRRSIDFPGGIPDGWNFFQKAATDTFSSAGTLNWADIDWIEVQIYSEPMKPSSIVKLDNLVISETPGPHDVVPASAGCWDLYN